MKITTTESTMVIDLGNSKPASLPENYREELPVIPAEMEVAGFQLDKQLVEESIKKWERIVGTQEKPPMSRDRVDEVLAGLGDKLKCIDL